MIYRWDYPVCLCPIKKTPGLYGLIIAKFCLKTVSILSVTNLARLPYIFICENFFLGLVLIKFCQTLSLFKSGLKFDVVIGSKIKVQLSYKS